jgi:hypothetical protein
MPTPQSTRAQLRTDVINWMDAAAAGGASHWDVTAGTGEVDRRLGMVHMQEWRRVLNSNAYYQIATYTPVTDANGNVPLSALFGGTGDAQQNLYRVVAVATGLVGQNGIFLNEVQSQQIPRYLMLAQTGIQYNKWFRNGQQLTMPGNFSMQMTIWTNYTPTRFDQLASDSSLVSLPDDYEDIFALEGAAHLLMKGGAETPASVDLKGQAEEMRRDRLQDLSRLGIAPRTVAAGDSSIEWGSQ